MYKMLSTRSPSYSWDTRLYKNDSEFFLNRKQTCNSPDFQFWKGHRLLQFKYKNHNMLEWSLPLICHFLLRNGAAMTTNKSDCTTDSLEPKTILCTEPMEQSTRKKNKTGFANLCWNVGKNQLKQPTENMLHISSICNKLVWQLH